MGGDTDSLQVSGTLHELISTFTNAEVRVSALCSELSTLISFLEAVDRTLKECRGQPLSLASMDEEMWYQSALSLADCKATLSDLENLTSRIKASVKHAGFFARVKATVDLTMYARDLAGFQEKIHKSNWALQTMLSAIIMYDLEWLHNRQVDGRITKSIPDHFHYVEMQPRTQFCMNWAG